MEDEPKVIRQHMDETRTSLSEKIDALESKVAAPVNVTIDAVTETVESVKESVASVTGALQDTVQSLRETFDLRAQFEQRPWLMLGGAVFLGYLGSRLLGSPGRVMSGIGSAVSAAAPVAMSAVSSAVPQAMAAMGSSSSSEPHKKEEPTVLSEALGSLRSLAVGSMMSLVRDLAAEHLPDNFAKSVSESVDEMTTRLGGKLIPPCEEEACTDETSTMNKEGSPAQTSFEQEEKPANARNRRNARVGSK